MKGKRVKKKGVPESHPADCGAAFRHNQHAYKTPKTGEVKICDGNTNKRL